MITIEVGFWGMLCDNDFDALGAAIRALLKEVTTLCLGHPYHSPGSIQNLGFQEFHQLAFK